MGKKKRHANNNFLVTLEKVNSMLDRAKLSCETIGILHEKGDFEELYDECFKLARSGERIALHTRNASRIYGEAGNTCFGSELDFGGLSDGNRLYRGRLVWNPNSDADAEKGNRTG